MSKSGRLRGAGGWTGWLDRKQQRSELEGSSQASSCSVFETEIVRCTMIFDKDQNKEMMIIILNIVTSLLLSMHSMPDNISSLFMY